MSTILRLVFVFFSYAVFRTPESAANPSSSNSNSTLDCTRSKQEWMQRLRYMPSHMPPPPASPMGTGDVCPVRADLAESCCDKRMKDEMYALSQRHLDQRIRMTWLPVAEQMNNDSVILENLFRSDLDNARDSLNQFFGGIYGYNYKQHRRFFYQFFENLSAYIIGQRNNLDELVTNFFSQLRDSIVGLIERSHQTAGGFNHPLGGGPLSPESQRGTGDDESVESARRIQCLSERVAQMHPFDEVDVRLKMRMLEAYPPVRMLITSLSATSRLLAQLVDRIASKPDCVLGLVRYEFCALCAGRSVSEVCPQTCLQLMVQCFQVNGSPDVQQFYQIWPRLMDVLVHTSVRLERSFNFPAVNRQLKMDISEAITSLQTRYQQSKSKFESECDRNAASDGRNPAALFSPSGASNRLAQSQHQPSLNRAPWSQRQKRSSGNSLVDSPMVSPTLLSWQTRRQPPGPASMMHQPNPQYPPMYPNQAAYAPPMNYPSYAGPGPASAPMGFGGAGQMLQPSWNMPPHQQMQPSVPNVSDRLLRWVAQLKHTYPKLGSLFANPAATFCPPTSPLVNNSQTANDTGCWNPLEPILQRLPADPGLSETARLFGLATERLQQVATNNGDPEAIQLPNTLLQHQPPTPNFLHNYAPPHQDINPMTPSLYGGGQMQPPPPVNPPSNQWGFPPSHSQQGQYNPYGNPQPNPMDMYSPGSGMDPSFWNEPQPPPSQQQPPSNFFYPPPVQQPPQQPDSNADQFGRDPYGYNVDLQYPVDSGENLPGSAYQPPYDWDSWPPQPTGDDTPSPTFDSGSLSFSGSIGQVTQTTTSSTPEQPTTTASARSLQTPLVTSKIDEGQQSPYPVLNTNKSINVSTNEISNVDDSPSTKRPHSLPEHHFIDVTTHATILYHSENEIKHTTPSSIGPDDQIRSSSPIPALNQPHPNFGGFQDNQIGQQPSPVFGQPHQTADSQTPPSLQSAVPPYNQPQPPWPQPQQPGAYQPEWWQDPYNPQGSGAWPLPEQIPPSNNQPQYPDQNFQPYEPYPGSGYPPYHPDQAPPVGPQILPQPSAVDSRNPNLFNPLPPSQNQPTVWQDPFYPAPPQNYPDNYPGSGMIDNPWNGGDGQPTNLPPPFWEDKDPATNNMIHPDPYPLPPSQLIPPPVETATQFPPSSNNRQRPVIPHPPPPEVWVPAQLEPGQHQGSSVLLVREYNVQGPFYGPDIVQTKYNRFPMSNVPWTITRLLPSVFFLFYCMRYCI